MLYVNFSEYMKEKIKNNKDKQISNNKPNLELVKGTRDYLPAEQLVREGIMDVLKTNFKKYGYSPIETTILEHWEIATSKYAGGEEILKETYKLTDQGGRDLALRYELTFKFGKLIGMNPEMRMPVKRYEIGKVFRDGPVKTGRLREFTQCDVDVIGTSNLVSDSEFMSMIFSVFKDLNIDVYVQINNRKILFGLFEEVGIPKDKHMDTALALDKLEKFGEQVVRNELSEKDISSLSINKLFELLNEATPLATNKNKLDLFDSKLTNQLAKQGITELKEIFTNCNYLGVSGVIQFVPTLSRGLAYYTGPMWEVYQKDAPESKITSSLAAGGRWDGMVQKFLDSKEEYPAVGMTFGLDPIYLVLEEKGIKKSATTNINVPSVLLVSINTMPQTLALATKLRDEGISTDISLYKRVKNAFEFANKQDIPIVAVLGETEVTNNTINIKNMVSGKEEAIKTEHMVERIKTLLRSTTQP